MIWGKRASIAAAALACAASPLWAFELKFTSSLASDSVNERLEAASLLVPLAAQDQTAPQDVLAAAQAEYGRIVGTLYDEGYFAPVVTVRIDGREAAAISPLEAPGRINRVEIRVMPGPLFQFGETALAPLPRGAETPAEFRTGKTATTRAIRTAVERGIEDWRDAGHAKVALRDQQITARHAQRRLDVNVTLDPGPLLRFGDLNVRGNQAVRRDRIIDIAGLPTGEVFDPEEIRRATVRLRRAGVFSVAALSEAEQIGPDNTLDIDAQFVEERPRRFGFGAEISSTDGLGVEAFWLHRNLFGGAERLRFEAGIEGIGGQTGGEDFRLSARFTRPATFNEDTDFFALAEIESLDEESFSSDRVSIEAGIRRYASERREYTFGLGLTRAKTLDAFGERDYTIFTLPASAEFDYRDNELNATSGYFAFASLTPFAAISGTESGLRTYLDARAYKTVGASQGLTFALRGQLGSLAGPSLADAPADFLFFSGGGGTVRGQDFQSLGIDLGGGQNIGGRSFLGLSGELRVKTTDKLSIVGFYDAGFISADAFPDGSNGDWHSGAGLGVRYDTGIGPIRVDLGVPVSGPGDNTGFELYIGIGQAF